MKTPAERYPGGARTAAWLRSTTPGTTGRRPSRPATASVATTDDHSRTCDDDTCRLEPIQNPFGPSLLPGTDRRWIGGESGSLGSSVPKPQ